MVSLLEEGLRSDDSDEYQTPSEEVTLTSIRLRLRRVTKIHHDVFIFYYFFTAPFDTPPLRPGGGGELLRVRLVSKKLGGRTTPEN
jgi:hypothetical protein